MTKRIELPQREELIFSTGSVRNTYHVTAYETRTVYASKEAKERALLYTVWNRTEEGFAYMGRYATAKQAIRLAVIYSELDDMPQTFYPDAGTTPTDELDKKVMSEKVERAKMIADSITDVLELRESLQPYGTEEE